MATKKAKVKTKVNQLTLVEAKALAKAAENLVKELEKEGQEIEAGAYQVNFTVNLSGAISKNFPTSSLPRFDFYPLVRSVLLLYASKTENPTKFIQDMFGPAVVKALLGTQQASVLKKVDPKVLTAFEGAEKQAKALFQEQAEKTEKSGATSVNCQLVKRDE